MNNSELLLINSTLYANSTETSANGGGLFNGSGTTFFSNTIIANSQGGPDCAGDIADISSQGHNLDGDGSCNLTAATDLPNQAPLLGLLSDNGGPTLTHLPQTGSPAIDAGDCSGGSVTVDQRGVVRPQGTACDIEAVEVEGPPPAGCNGPLAQEGEHGELFGNFVVGDDPAASMSMSPHRVGSDRPKHLTKCRRSTGVTASITV